MAIDMANIGFATSSEVALQDQKQRRSNVKKSPAWAELVWPTVTPAVAAEHRYSDQWKKNSFRRQAR